MHVCGWGFSKSVIGFRGFKVSCLFRGSARADWSCKAEESTCIYSASLLLLFD